MKSPLVTIIVPAYNHENYVLECLESIHNQTYHDFQWIVVDDCSKDRTPIILKENQAKYGYELILHNKNIGISATLTEAIRDYSSGKYITICASDDICLPNKIEEHLRFMQANPQFGMTYSKPLKMNQKSEEIENREDYSRCKSGYVFEDVICRRFPIGNGAMYRADVLKDVGYYESGVIAEDYFMRCKIAKKYEIGFLDKFLSKYRVVELSQKRDPWRLVQSHKQTVDMFKDDSVYPKAVKAWQVNSAGILVFYTKYKFKSMLFVLRNLDYYITHPGYLFSWGKCLLLSWK